MASPAGFRDLIIGKGVASAFYALLTGGIVTVLHKGYQGDWPITLIATLLMIVITAGIGILFGMWSHNKNECSAYSTFVLMFLVIPTWFTLVNFDTLSPILQWILRLNPGYYYARIMMHSINGLSTSEAILPNLIILTLTAILILVIVGWQAHRKPVWQV